MNSEDQRLDLNELFWWMRLHHPEIVADAIDAVLLANKEFQEVVAKRKLAE